MTRPVVVVGAGGQLGRQLVEAFARGGREIVGLTHEDLEIGDEHAGEAVSELGPGLVVNAAAWTDVDGCAREPDRAMELNGRAPGRLAAAAAGVGAGFVQISTNEVFDGDSREAYDEESPTHPLNPYGAAKLAGEQAVAVANVDHLIVRTAWLFGPGGRNFPSKIVEAAHAAAARHEALRVVDDEVGNPTWTPALAEAIVTAVRAGVKGVLNLAGEPAASRYEWAALILAAQPDAEVHRIKRRDYARSSTAPAHAVLDMRRARGLGIPPLEWREQTRMYAAALKEGVA